ncbi:hypothetical protein P3S67_029401 [Capsicum chacoense]
MFIALSSGGSVILSSTVSPSFVSQLEKLLQSDPKKLKLVDSQVSGRVKRAVDGTLMMSKIKKEMKKVMKTLTLLEKILGCG